MLDTTKRFQEAVASTHLPSLPFYQLIITDEPTKITESKLGGCPYIPVGGSLPLASNHTPLIMLAQLNLSQFAEDIFPIKEGILQFWLEASVFYGQDFVNPCCQENFRVIYYNELTTPISEEEVMAPYSDMDEKRISLFPLSSPLTANLKITGRVDTRRITPDDFEFEYVVLQEYNRLFPDTPISHLRAVILPALDAGEDEIINQCLESEAENHCLLGYPTFTKNDPRTEQESFREYILLFQLDSDDFNENELVWRDCGIANWFIHPDDLKKGDFSRVLFHWDCC